MKVCSRLPLRLPCQTMHKHCTELVPVLGALPLQLQAPALQLPHQALRRPPRRGG
eukprot:CAMPEP_0168417294 /NCGR_PEP_ID=MMETSP0228-20121227/31180_1 /TAXON_ID=133427 /ORGANISM="Protoceratium reticulatum, Strain CCCM 535 (=CCMP 1889)" /LENGTH=54 /DNA_ID=CAMNT_0008431143 /DNA_START=152 /DNA_END=312 /DNA_ORIENTATION=-